VSSLDENDELALTAVTQLKNAGLGDEPAQGQLQLSVFGNGAFATHPIAQGVTVTIGRSRTCDIMINDESISRRHAVIHVAETVTIEDSGSANGTVVHGEKIPPGQRCVIAIGEVVGLGTASIMLQRKARSLRTRRLWAHDYFEARLDEECAREARSGAAFALVRIQPERGVTASHFEDALGELLRDSDIVGKYGPDDYEVLLPDTPAINAEEAVQRIEKKLLDRGLRCRIAYACCPRDGTSPYQLAARVQPARPRDKQKSAAPAGAEVVVSDPQMKSLYRLVEQIAGSDICVLLLGETGVGKEVFARAVHRASPRASGPFVEINCAALTETLLESELFGHEKGAFTHAVSTKPGLLEMAHGGTLLLDEIGDMPLSTQVKLLRVIEDSKVRRVGSVKSKDIDVRFVAATNADIENQVENSSFRRDLFFRLNGVTIVIPPLRERSTEIEAIARAFVLRARPDKPPELSKAALDLMRGYSWPGNVRELKNVIERAVLLCGSGPILPEHLPLEKMDTAPRMFTWLGTRPPVVAPPPAHTVLPPRPRKGSEEEQQLILRTLEQAKGNQTVAARLLGISRRTLVNRLNEYANVTRPRKGSRKQRSV
jgi:two-component system response regulator AtoC